MGVGGKCSPIPVTRRHHLQVFTDALEAQGVSSKSIARRLGLPMWQYGGADDWIPLKDTLVLLREAARAAGDEQFGMLVSRTRHPASTTTIGRLVQTSPTLYHALKKTCRIAKRHTSLAHVWIFDAGDKLWLCRSQFAEMSAGLRQHEQYVIGFLLELIRHAAGPTWQPAEMWVSTARQPRFEESDDLSDTTIRYDQPHTAIALPKWTLSRSLGSELSIGSSPAMGLEHPLRLPADDFAGSLCQILMSLMTDGPPSLNEVAEIICLHPRTLQRRLRSAGVTYQSVVDEARFRVSTSLLKQTGATATGVGSKLGYSNLSSFSRAFSRYAGMSPRQYLHLNTQS